MIEVYQRRAKFTKLKPYDFSVDEDDCIEITNWANGEGFDVLISSTKNEKTFSLSYAEWEAIQALVAYRDGTEYPSLFE